MTIQTPEVDPSNGLVELPDTPLDATSLIGQDPCLQGEGSSLVSSGRGGLPPTPQEALDSEYEPLAGLVDLPPEGTRDGDRATSALVRQPDRLVEAQGWIIGPDGEVILTADSPTLTPFGTSAIPELPTCTPRSRSKE